MLPRIPSSAETLARSLLLAAAEEDHIGMQVRWHGSQVQCVQQPVIGTVDSLPLAKLERAEGVRDVLQRIDDAMGEVIAAGRRAARGG